MGRVIPFFLAAAVSSVPVTNAHAFGLGDIVGIGIQAGGKLIGAAIDKGIDAVKESMRDPEAEAREKAEQERKLAELMQKQIDEIEAKPGLRPIDREKLILGLKQTWRAAKEMQALVERAEAQQKAERDKIFTAEGILGVVGEAALSSPSMVIARANAMTKDPVWQAQRRMSNEAIFAQANAQVAAGIPQARARVAIAQADVLQKSGVPQAGARTIVENAESLAKGKEAVIDLAEAASAVHDVDDSHEGRQQTPEISVAEDVAKEADMPVPGSTEGQAAAIAPDAFSPDLGRRLWIEFEDSPTESERIRKLLLERGHVLAESKDEAEVVYLVQGEFEIPESKLHEGVTKSIGALLENPTTTIDPPPAKVMGKFSAGIASLLMRSAGQQIPQAETKGYRQRALLVIARQPKDGRETRASVVQTTQGETIEAPKLAKAVTEELYRMVGL